MNTTLWCAQVNQKVDYERQCRRTLAKPDFIASILNFDVDQLVQNFHVAATVDDKYLGGVACLQDHTGVFVGCEKVLCCAFYIYV